MLDEFVYYNELYDYYGELLTEKQQNYFEDYYQNNLSLSEIADNNKISRNAVSKQLQVGITKLEEYEKILKLLDKKKKIEELLNDCDNQNLKKEILELL